MKKVGLYFGTFNPIHKGHLALGNYFLKHTDLEEIRFIVSPQNPFKTDQELLAEHHRLEMVRLAIEKLPQLNCSDVEFSLPKPSYTTDTLKHLIEKEPGVSFVLLMGEDNMVHFEQWKDYQTLLMLVELYVYPRKHGNNISEVFLNHPKIQWTAAPHIPISATEIREGIKRGKNMSDWVPQACWNYLTTKKLYQ